MDDQDKAKLTTTVGIKGNIRYITITSNQEEQWDKIIDVAKMNYHWYAYVFHDKDDTEKHLHIMAYDKGGTSIKAHCARFEGVIPPNFVCKVRNPRAMARYLIHMDSPEKHRYQESDIVTNNTDKYHAFLEDLRTNVMEEYQDFSRVKHGLMTPEDFIDKYKSQIFDLPFQSKISVYHKIFSIPEAGVGGKFLSNNKGVDR